MKLLCTGDIHIGRRASRLPAFAQREARRYSCAAAWDAVVALALRERVDLLLLSGDVVDEDNHFFEAFGPLEAGLRKLAAAGVMTFAVSGNHDYDVLPRLVQSVGPERFRLLGEGGRWERHSVVRDGRVRLHIDGWSFPDRKVMLNPLDGYALPRDDAAPTIGLVHGDLDQPRSVFAPLALRDLQARPLALWLLGHIHKPAHLTCDGGACVLYPGSPQAMDPGETGPHGPWLIELREGRLTRCEQVLLSTIRYDQLTISLDGIDDRDALHDRVTRAVRRHLDEAARACEPLGVLSCRLRLTGRSRIHRHVGEHLRELCDTLELQDATGRVGACIDELEIDTRPELDIESLARGGDPPGLVARTILALSRPQLDADHAQLVHAARAKLEDIHRHRAFAGLAVSDEAELSRDETTACDAEAARALLLRESWSLLDTLVAQKEGEG